MSTHPVCARQVPVLRLFRRLVRCAAGLLLAAALASCSVQQEVRINADGSGTTTVSLRLADAVVSYLTDLQSMLGDPGRTSTDGDPLPLFDLDQLMAAFNARPGVTLISAKSPSRDTLVLDVAFGRADRLLTPESADPTVPPVVTFERTGASSTLRVHLSRSNFGVISGMFFMPDSPVAVLLPVKPSDFFDRAEYVDLFSYAFEEYAGDQPVATVLENARLEITIRTDGPITAQSGGTPVGDAVRFSIPVLDVLTLENDLDYSVTWR